MTVLLWILFLLFVAGMLALDLGVLHRRAHVVGIREALIWSAIWVGLSLLFNVGVYFMYEHHWLGIGLHVGHDIGGAAAALQYFTGYVIEKSLSLDNIFVIALIMAYFQVPPRHQHRVLYWGILGAILMRGVMIVAGVGLIRRFDWIVYVFGAILLIAAGKMFFSRREAVHPDRNPLVRLARRLYPVSADFEESRFFTRVNGLRAVTPLFLVLLVIESTDLLFAVDSIPAIFAVTRDPFIVFTSNVFAILGLRSLYFALAGMMDKFRYLKFSLVVVLAYVGVKLLLSHHYPIPTVVSLGIIVAVLCVGIGASLVVSYRDAVGGPLLSFNTIHLFAMMTLRQVRRIVVIVIGLTVLLLGIALLFLPGPAIVVLPIGLAILGTEFLWARRLLRRLKQEGERLVRRSPKQGAPPGQQRPAEVSVDDYDGLK